MKNRTRKFRAKAVNHLKQYSPTLLTIIAGAGVIVTAVSAVKATPKALQLIKRAEYAKEGELTKKEIVKTVWKNYVPSAALGTATVVCIFGSNALSRKHLTALTSAYTLAAGNYTAYKNKVKEVYGKDANEQILKSIAVEKASDTTICSYSFSGKACLDFEDVREEELLFYDVFSNRYFQSTIGKVLQAEYHLNRNFVLKGVVSLNDFYEFLGLEKTEYGEIVGWNSYSEIYWIDFDHSKTTTDDGLEIYLVEPVFEPTAEALTED